jgi:quinol monooxygenase YgiN
MIRLNCFFQANDSEQYKTALKAAIALTELSQKHEGCIAYDVFQSATRPDVFMICETWKDPESLDKHSATPEFKKYSPMMRQCGQMKVERFNNA